MGASGTVVRLNKGTLNNQNVTLAGTHNTVRSGGTAKPQHPCLDRWTERTPSAFPGRCELDQDEYRHHDVTVFHRGTIGK